MRGDFSRSTSERDKHYASVNMQQGRVQTDTDWNEQADAADYRKQTATSDMIIDMHVHSIFQDTPITSETSRLIQLNELTSKTYFNRSQKILSIAEFQQEMRDAGIDRVVLQVNGVKGIPARQTNELVARLRLRMFPDTFMGFAGFDPNQGEEAVADIDYAIKHLGFRGLKAISSLLELDINDKAVYPCYAKAQELGVPITIHTGDSLVMGYRTKYVEPWMVDDVAFDFPDLSIICAHMGGHRYMDVHSMMVRHPNVYADLSFWPLNPHYRDLIPWRLLEETVPDKILLGSDYPCGQTPKEAVETVQNLPVSEEFKLKILGKNAARLLGL